MVKPFGILMPNWNKERYVGAAIDSVLRQTDSDWHLAIVDDSSTDGSLDEIGARVDARITVGVVAHRGPGAASRKAMELLRRRGVEHIGILDSDDALHPDAVRLVRQAYERNPDCGVVYTQNWRATVNGLLETKVRGRARAIPPGETALSVQEKEHTLPVNHWLTFSAAAYDRTEGFAVMPRHQDMDLIFKLEEVAKLYFLDELLYHYRVLEDGLHTGKLVPDFAHEVRQRARERRAAQHSRMPK